RHLASGKVRELYDIDADTLLFVATDRISAYDFILDTEIPDKGPDPDGDERVLLRSGRRAQPPGRTAGRPAHSRRGARPRLVVRKLDMMPVECVARGGYVLAGSPADADVLLIATGSEVALALGARDALAADGVSAAVISMPCVEWFDAQPQEYRDT
ncbi:phosphoribosylaminoimidazolesuccinocarboxamide synthase, partial [Mycolicibacterium insubricum]|uniref:phosphoribosylaminoimidazolesuccinocarboxamide synthase n=1 Tax=Mycolicibacterium insubricum TaxID=444597 RepID=UPI0024B344C0